MAIDPATFTPDPPKGGGGRCLLCGGMDIREKFRDSDAPTIPYCLDCLWGIGGPFPAVDMRLFESCIYQRDQKRKTAQTSLLEAE